MAQLVTRVDDALLAEIDHLVAEGSVESRSDAVRIALRQLLERRRRQEAGQSIVDDYLARPQTESEVGWSDSATIAMIADEAW